MRKNDTLKQALDPDEVVELGEEVENHARPVTEKQRWAPDVTQPDEIPTYVRGDIEPELKG